MVSSRFPVALCKEKKMIVPYIVSIDEMKKSMPIVQKSECLPIHLISLLVFVKNSCSLVTRSKKVFQEVASSFG